jgi:nucleotide-binding universal stress UspA family protein
MSMFPTKILLATDGSDEAGQAARMAVQLSGKFDSELHMASAGRVPSIYATPEWTIYDPDAVRQFDEIALREARKVLNQQTQKIEEAGGSVAGSHPGVGRPDEQVVQLAEELGVGLIVVGSRGLGGLRRALLGSVSDSIVRHAHCPVLIVRGEENREVEAFFPGKVLVAMDGSDEAALAVRTAVEISAGTGSELHLAYVLPTDQNPFPHAYGMDKYVADLEQAKQDSRTYLEKQKEQIEDEGGSVAEVHIRSGRPDEEIVHLSEELGVALIVTGSRGLGGVKRALMGSVSNSVVRHAGCPVLVMRGSESNEPNSSEAASSGEVPQR